VESPGAVSLRDYVEALLDARDKLQAERLQGTAKALKLAHKETLRRLDVLNHAHEEAQQNWAKTLPRETFGLYSDEQQRWKDAVNKELTTIATRATTYTAVLGLLFVALQIGIALYRR
jgi:uncharacterized protein YukE